MVLTEAPFGLNKIDLTEFNKGNRFSKGFKIIGRFVNTNTDKNDRSSCAFLLFSSAQHAHTGGMVSLSALQSFQKRCLPAYLLRSPPVAQRKLLAPNMHVS